LKILKSAASASQEIKKSNFIAVLCEFGEFDTTLKILRENHPKAAHIAWAYRFQNEFRQIAENQSDDGEPKGSAGAPILSALRGADLIECACLVVRYFGGIKLGVGGLVRAYSSSANLAIKSANLIEFENREMAQIWLPFAEISKFEYFLNTNKISNSPEFDDAGATFTLQVTRAEFLGLKEYLRGLKSANFAFKTEPNFN